MQHNPTTKTHAEDAAWLDGKTVDALYRKHQRRIRGRAQRMLRTDGEDILQEVFLRLVRDRPHPAAVERWLWVTTGSLCIDRIRHRQRRQDDWKENVKEHFTPAQTSVEDSVARKRLCGRVMAHTDDLTRKIVTAVYVDDRSQVEAARRLGISRKTVRRRLERLHSEASDLLGPRS